ncbi:MAG TPA: CopG family transcriptional regulator [Mesorhizobium sp.]|jgi:RHH-type rel operon transcriptional repressor/antitoxin RelB
MLTVKLPPDMEHRLEAVAARLGRSTEDVALEAILEEIQDLEDGLIALERMEDGKAEFFTMEEVRERLGLIESE